MNSAVDGRNKALAGFMFSQGLAVRRLANRDESATLS
jgi:hypothetical protein